jgi:hypothetical protein
MQQPPATCQPSASPDKRVYMGRQPRLIRLPGIMPPNSALASESLSLRIAGLALLSIRISSSSHCLVNSGCSVLSPGNLSFPVSKPALHTRPQGEASTRLSMRHAECVRHFSGAGPWLGLLSVLMAALAFGLLPVLAPGLLRLPVRGGLVPGLCAIRCRWPGGYPDCP